jgi:hypothetical protein
METMMISPNCPEHGRLVLDLALGRLADDEAVRAEKVRYDCSVCRDWWREQFEGEDAALIDEAVASVFADLDLPTRRRKHGWLAVAAAAVMTVGVGALWMARDPQPVEPAAVEQSAAIQVINFEDPDLVPVVVTTSADLREENAVSPPAFVPATIKAEDSNGTMVASATPTEEMTEGEDMLFAGGFESGTTAGWGVPST